MPDAGCVPAGRRAVSRRRAQRHGVRPRRCGCCRARNVLRAGHQGRGRAGVSESTCFPTGPIRALHPRRCDGRRRGIKGRAGIHGQARRGRSGSRAVSSLADVLARGGRVRASGQLRQETVWWALRLDAEGGWPGRADRRAGSSGAAQARRHGLPPGRVSCRAVSSGWPGAGRYRRDSGAWFAGRQSGRHPRAGSHVGHVAHGSMPVGAGAQARVSGGLTRRRAASTGRLRRETVWRALRLDAEGGGRVLDDAPRLASSTRAVSRAGRAPREWEPGRRSGSHVGPSFDAGWTLSAGRHPRAGSTLNGRVRASGQIRREAVWRTLRLDVEGGGRVLDDAPAPGGIERGGSGSPARSSARACFAADEYSTMRRGSRARRGRYRGPGALRASGEPGRRSGSHVGMSFDAGRTLSAGRHPRAGSTRARYRRDSGAWFAGRQSGERSGLDAEGGGRVLHDAPAPGRYRRPGRLRLDVERAGSSFRAASPGASLAGAQARRGIDAIAGWPIRRPGVLARRYRGRARRRDR